MHGDSHCTTHAQEFAVYVLNFGGKVLFSHTLRTKPPSAPCSIPPTALN